MFLLGDILQVYVFDMHICGCMYMYMCKCMCVYKRTCKCMCTQNVEHVLEHVYVCKACERHVHQGACVRMCMFMCIRATHGKGLCIRTLTILGTCRGNTIFMVIKDKREELLGTRKRKVWLKLYMTARKSAQLCDRICHVVGAWSWGVRRRELLMWRMAGKRFLSLEHAFGPVKMIKPKLSKFG